MVVVLGLAGPNAGLGRIRNATMADNSEYGARQWQQIIANTERDNKGRAAYHDILDESYAGNGALCSR